MALNVSFTSAPPTTPSTVQASGAPVSVDAAVVVVVVVVETAVVLVVLLVLLAGAGAGAVVVVTTCEPVLEAAVTVYVAEALQAPNLMHKAPVRRPRLPWLLAAMAA